MIDQLLFAFQVTGPILIILILGYLFFRYRLINQEFISIGNKLVFNVTLPCMLFLSISGNSIAEIINIRLILCGVVITLGSVLILWVISPFFISKEKCGVFIQGSFRSNMGIIGIALILNAYGSHILPKAGMYLAILTIIYNFLSIWLLRSKKDPYILTILKNPLILAIALGLFLAWFEVSIPKWMESSGEYFSSMTLPLALLCIGGTLQWKSLRENRKEIIIATVLKLILIPIIGSIGAIFYGLKGENLGILFFMTATPTAAASYVMAKQMTPYGNMAAEIIAISTSLSTITITIGILILRYFGYI